jgi:hypothetical protein
MLQLKNKKSPSFISTCVVKLAAVVTIVGKMFEGEKTKYIEDNM